MQKYCCAKCGEVFEKEYGTVEVFGVDDIYPDRYKDEDVIPDIALYVCDDCVDAL